MKARPRASGTASRATRTASPVPRGGSCLAAAAAWAEATTCAMSGRPAAGWSTLHVRERILVPSPAARMNAVTDERSSSSLTWGWECYPAGAGGLAPPVGDPKPPALPLGHAPMLRKVYGRGPHEGRLTAI